MLVRIDQRDKSDRIDTCKALIDEEKKTERTVTCLGREENGLNVINKTWRVEMGDLAMVCGRFYIFSFVFFCLFFLSSFIVYFCYFLLFFLLFILVGFYLASYISDCL